MSPSNTNRPGADQLPALTGVRFLAAMAIAVGHAAGSNSWAAAANHIRWGDAVPFFFLLSGFILAHVYPRIDNGTQLRRFWQARFARIYPLHLATLLLILVVLSSPHRTSTRELGLLAANLTLTQSWLSESTSYFSFNATSWSISVEAFLYAVFPLLIFRWRQTWWLWLGLGFGLYAWLPNLVSATTLVAVFPPRHLLHFAAGIGAASLFRWLRARWTPGRSTGTVCEILAVAAIVAIERQMTSLPLMSAGPLQAAAFGGLLIALGLGRGWLAQLLGTRPMVVLGEISFALYLFHQIVLRVMLARGYTAWGDTAFFCTYLAISLAGSWALWRWCEGPARTWIMGWFAPSSASQPAVAASAATTSGTHGASSAIPRPHFVRQRESWNGRSEPASSTGPNAADVPLAG